MTYQGLAQVEFGHIAAEEEAAALQKYFIETKEYSEILDKGKLLVIGRKGSGKSAIYVGINKMKAILQQEKESEKEQEHAQRIDLLQLLNQYFNEEELKTLSFSLGIEYDDLPASGKANKARELVRYTERRNRTAQLLAECQRMRPSVFGSISSQQHSQEYDPVKLRNIIETHFNENELREVCFTLKVDYESIPGRSKREKATELVTYMQRRAMLATLVSRLHELIPNIPIDELYRQQAQEIHSQTSHVSKRVPIRKRRFIVEALTLNDYPWEIHKQIKDAGVPIEQSYVNSWKYIIWVLLAKKYLSYDEPARFKLVDSTFWKIMFSSNVRFLRRYLKQNYGSIAPSFGEILADQTREIRSLKFKEIIEVGTDTPANRSQRLSRSINIINRTLESRLLTILPKGKEYYLLFDQLDLGWDETENTKQLLIGLIMAARDVIRAAKKADKEVRVVVFLRSDIYESLRFEDKNKVWWGDTVKLNWDESRLKELINKRIKTSADGVWENVFSGERIEGMSQLSYVVKRTMLRPRDMIQFCKCAQESALRANKDVIDNESILEGCKAYSDYMRGEIQDECQASFPEIGKVLTLLKGIGSQKISQQQFVQRCEKGGMKNGKVILQELINLSVLGICHQQQTDFRYQGNYWETLEPTKELAIHPSLLNVLSIPDQ